MPAVSFSHIGITVPDLDRAVEFYTKAFDLYLLMPPAEVLQDNSAIGEMCDDVFGAGWGRFRIAHLSTGDGVGIELFEFPKTDDSKPPFDYWKPGIFHFCLQDSDLEERVKRIEALGGKQRMQQVRYYYPDQKPYRMVYCEDPFGNLVELYSHSYELTYSSGAYSDDA
ncbi:lactoylglutathione lyase family protein [Shimia sp.]|jgi:lactoylglutathione lyase family protein|uniref:lactoylglutathione lyase family protein n=1 Tax=unclassified Shimia TaxID=2630038 RepID=UPI0025EE0FB1|nr:lactoylglutathione lyase family protein [Shimia sp.]MCH2067461.1 lactoylglutathione lyase family protein [Shimia sp.]